VASRWWLDEMTKLRNWSLRCGKSMLATYDGVLSVQAQLNKLLVPLGGNCDGWGTFGNTQ